MNTLAQAQQRYRKTWRFFSATVVVIALFSLMGVAAAQDGASGPGAPDAVMLQSRIFLPLLSTAGTPGLQQSEENTTIGITADNNIDGEWSYPRNDLGETPVTCEFIDNSTDDPTNENVVRYGQPISSADCGSTVFRSGFGFDGNNVASFVPNQPFLLGQFTHYNNNIVTPLVPMQLVDLSVRVQTLDPTVDLTMTYTMRLDETINDGSCPYGATNSGLCDDKVDFVNNTPPQTLVVNGVTYTLNILGFVPGTVGTCQYTETLTDYFITGELVRNDACVFAEFIQPQPAITISKSPDLQKIVAGDIAEFDITVANSGNVGLNSVTVADPLTPDCAREIGEMKAGATLSYACTAYGVEQDFENIATVTGAYAGVQYTASDAARVDVLAPDTATLFAFKYYDQNGNGQRDAGEPGLQGWTFCVKDATGANVGLCQTTDVDGFATLTPNQSGDFQLCEVLQNGWVNTDPGDGTVCKPVTVTQAPLYAELYPTANDIYGVELTEKSSDQQTWTYAVYQFLDSQAPDAWVLALPSCIDEAQIDPAGTTAGWSLVDDSITGLRGLRWPTTAIPVEGVTFQLALLEARPTGASSAGVIVDGNTPVAATDVVAGPVCDPPILIGNNATVAPTGTLEVRKVVEPTADSGRFNLLIDHIVVASNVQDGGSTGAQQVNVGVHSVGESAGLQTSLADYLSSLRCIETNNGSAWTPDATGQVYVAANENVVCTFTNIRRGAITVVKQVTGSAIADWSFSSTLGAFTLPAAGGQRSFTQLAPGTYSVLEQQIAGWGLGALTCVDPSFDTQASLTTATATINLAPGEAVTCTFSNIEETGSITVIKQVNGVASAPWSFTGTLGDFSFDATGGTRVFENLAPGAYSIREMAAENWHVGAINCTDPDNGTTVDVAAGAATVDLDPREPIVCTFVNEPGTPAIALDKSADATTIYPGTRVNYTFAVSNPGQVALNNIRIDDAQCTVAPTVAGNANVGDSDADGWLDVNEVWQFACDAILTTDTTNIATAWGDAPWGEQVWAQDSVTVDVIAPAVRLEKTADQAEVASGAVVNYAIVVQNSGDTPLFNVTVEDGLPACVLNGPSGDSGNGILDPAETWTYTCAMSVVADTTNTAIVEAYDSLGARWTASDSASVKVIQPAIDIVKSASQYYVYPNEAVDFTMKVRNTGSTWLSNVNVSDSIDACRLSAPSGDDGDGQLAPAEEWTYTCQIVFCSGEYFPLPGASTQSMTSDPSSICSDITNVATVSALDPTGKTVTDQDSVFVDLIRPKLQVVKQADITYVSPGQPINFSIYVRNVGDTPLMDVVVTDSMPECVLSAPTGDDGDGVLSPAEEWRYTCSASVLVDTVNTARAEAKDVRGTTWWDEDSVAITVCLD